MSTSDQASSSLNIKDRIRETTPQRALKQAKKATLPVTLLQTPKAQSPYPAGPFGQLGLGPGSPFFSYCRSKHNFDSTKEVEFVISYKASNNSIKKIVDRPKGTFSGSKLYLFPERNTQPMVFPLQSKDNHWVFTKTGFGAHQAEIGGNWIMGPTCVYPEGKFYFSVKNKTKYEIFIQKVNSETCGQKTTCTKNINITNGPIIAFQQYGSDYLANSIAPSSYLMVDEGKLRVLVTQEDDLFAAGGPCEGSELAVGRLFLYEMEVGYYIDQTGTKGQYYAFSSNSIGSHTGGWPWLR